MKKYSPLRIVMYVILASFVYQVGTFVYREFYAISSKDTQCAVDADCAIIVNGCESRDIGARDEAVSVKSVEKLKYLQACNGPPKFKLIQKSLMEARCQYKKCVKVDTGKTVIRFFDPRGGPTEEEIYLHRP